MPDLNDFYVFQSTSRDSGGSSGGCGLYFMGLLVLIIVEVLKACGGG